MIRPLPVPGEVTAALAKVKAACNAWAPVPTTREITPPVRAMETEMDALTEVQACDAVSDPVSFGMNAAYVGCAVGIFLAVLAWCLWRTARGVTDLAWTVWRGGRRAGSKAP